MQAWLDLRPEKKRSITNADLYGGELPPIDDQYGHLIEVLREIGSGLAGFAGLVPLSWSEIDAYSRQQDFALSPFESNAIRLMSCAFCGIASDPESECPIQSDAMRQRIDEIGIESWLVAAR